MSGFSANLRAVLGALLVLSSGASGAATLQSNRAGERWAVVEDGADLWLLTPEGKQRRLSRERGLELTSLAAVDDGFFAAGTRLVDAGSGEVSRRLVLLRGDRSTVSELPLPQGSDTARLVPRLLVEGNDLRGLTWLEGNHPGRLVVKAAVWDGRRFRLPRDVAMPGSGSQTGLRATVLADGSWLVVWVRYDGDDDEIVYSRFQNGSFQRWRGVFADNAVPDIAPTLVATESGALLVSLRFDGEQYRQRIASFANDRWLDLGWLERAVESELLRDSAWPGEGILLLFRSAQEAGWSLARLTERGELTAAGTWPQQPRQRPVVEGWGDAVRLVFPQSPAARSERAADGGKDDGR